MEGAGETVPCCATPCAGLSRSLSPIAAFSAHPTARKVSSPAKNILGVWEPVPERTPGSPSNLNAEFQVTFAGSGQLFEREPLLLLNEMMGRSG